jgi:hypothetical protein
MAYRSANFRDLLPHGSSKPRESGVDLMSITI